MAKLTPDATRTEHGLVINEKIIPWGAVWPKDSGAYKKGAQYNLLNDGCLGVGLFSFWRETHDPHHPGRHRGHPSQRLL